VGPTHEHEPEGNPSKDYSSTNLPLIPNLDMPFTREGLIDLLTEQNLDPSDPDVGSLVNGIEEMSTQARVTSFLRPLAENTIKQFRRDHPDLVHHEQ